MITLYQPAPSFGLLNASPFCMKLEGFLRWQNIDYQTEIAQPDQGPYKKVPFIGYNENILGDSNAIIYHLLADNNIQYADDADFSHGVAYQRLAEDHLYFALLYFRWMDDEVWPQLKDSFFQPIPEPMRTEVADQVREGVKQTLYSQGLGRLPKEDILEAAKADLAELNAHLAKHSFICGETMTHFDFAVWGILSQIIDSKLVIQLTPLAQPFTALQAFLARINSVVNKR